MIKIGITGQSGFVGTHLYNILGLKPDEYERIRFEDAYFKSEEKLRDFVKKCDVIVHLAAMNRHPESMVLYETNLRLVKQLIAAMEAENARPHLLFSSSTQEDNESEYGMSKREGRRLLENWAKKNGASFTGLVIPNVYGPFGEPNYNSFVATFCYKLTHGETPQIIQDNDVCLIYVGNLCRHILMKIKEVHDSRAPIIERDDVPYDFESKVGEVLSQLKHFKDMYFDNGHIPELKSPDQVNLFNTFRCYISKANHFPVKLEQHADSRGVFVETIKLGVGGQVSFSVTYPGATRGNHYHTRKIERFTVIKGKAKIQIRRIGSKDVLDFYLDGSEPSYVDIPIWYTHNIKNIGTDELYTQFWINEWFNPDDGDTYFERV